MDEQPTTRLTVRAIGAIVADDYGVPFSVMAGASRSQEFVRPRQVTMWLCHRRFGFSLPQIGKVLGQRDHTTVLHGTRVIEALRHEDFPFAERLSRIIDRVNAAEAGMIAWAPTPAPIVPTPAPAPAEEAAPAPVVWAGPSPAQLTVLDALAGYLTARDVLIAQEHTRGEFGARRQAEAAYATLRSAYAEMKRSSHRRSAAA